MDKLRASARRISLVWWLVVGLFVLGLATVGAGWWQSAAAGLQVQTPMFYDDHYIYPRPWTQEQSAPGIPDPALVSVLYGANSISQPFVGRADHLSLIKLWLEGPAGVPVKIALQMDSGQQFSGNYVLESDVGRYVYLSFPAVEDSEDRHFNLILAAPSASSERPVGVRTVGGDRLGGSHILNEFPRAGNVELFTFSRAAPGTWWFRSIGEQLLPAVFAQRLQQYKPEPFKGSAFGILLSLAMLLSLLFLILSRPGSMPLRIAIGWGLAILLATFLSAELLLGRLILPIQVQPFALQSGEDMAPPSIEGERTEWLVHDLSLSLWTAEREPEARFVHSIRDVDGLGAIGVPAASALRYPLVAPPGSMLIAGLSSDADEGTRFSAWLDDQEIMARDVKASDGTIWIDADLSTWAGQERVLTLKTTPLAEGGDDAARWIRPQISARREWLFRELPVEAPGFQAVKFQFTAPDSDQRVDLLGYRVSLAESGGDEKTVVTLYWQGQDHVDRYGTVFVHLVDEQGQILAQHDGQPVLGTYPLPTWSPGLVIADDHSLSVAGNLPGPNTRLAVGFYDPSTLQRWAATGPDGQPLPDNRAILSLADVEGTP